MSQSDNGPLGFYLVVGIIIGIGFGFGTSSFGIGFASVIITFFTFSYVDAFETKVNRIVVALEKMQQSQEATTDKGGKEGGNK